MIRRSLLSLAAVAAAGLIMVGSSAALAEAPSLVKSAQASVLVAVAATDPAPQIQYAVAVVEVDQTAPAALMEAAYDPLAAGRGPVGTVRTAILISDIGSPEVLPGRHIAARRTWIV